MVHQGAGQGRPEQSRAALDGCHQPEGRGQKGQAEYSKQNTPVNNTNNSGNLSLSDKQKLLKDSEIASKLASQPQLKPHKTMATKPSNQTKDLTATLMEANVNQMKTSQTFSNFNLQQQQSTSWRPQQHTVSQNLCKII